MSNPENNNDHVLPEEESRGESNVSGSGSYADEQLFKDLGKAKKRKKRKLIITIIIVVAVVVAVLFVATRILRKKVNERFNATESDVISEQATVGSISTTVSGTGVLQAVDAESLTIPEDVEVEEVLVSANDTVEEGDIIAKLDAASIAAAMEDVQSEIDTLDDEIVEADEEELDEEITAGVDGRVKAVYANAGDMVTTRMAADGALLLISADGYMAVDIEQTDLTKDEIVTVQREDGTALTGTVNSVSGGVATILLSDDGTSIDEKVTILDGDGKELGTGALYVHNPIRVTGIGGTIGSVDVSENEEVESDDVVITLSDTNYTGNTESLIKERNEKEEVLLELLALKEQSALTAPFSGTIISVEYDEDEDTGSSSASSSSSAMSAAMAAAGYTGGSTAGSSAGSTGSSSSSSSEGETEIVTMAPDDQVSVTIDVDETDILSLEVGQQADVTISSVGEDTYEGLVDEINKEATTSSGVTEYSATVVLDKAEGMLTGMTADVAIRIEGVDDAILVPLEAVHQTSSSAYVYTSYDEETQEFGGEVEVITGLSNANYIEIKSGLKEGDTVYYTDTSNSMFDMFGGMGDSGMGDFDMSDMQGGMGGMSGGDSAGGPGGSMPGGDNGGGMGGGMPGGRGGSGS